MCETGSLRTTRRFGAELRRPTSPSITIDTRGLMLGSGYNFSIMNQFAEHTGGRGYYNGNEVAGAVERAIADL